MDDSLQLKKKIVESNPRRRGNQKIQKNKKMKLKDSFVVDFLKDTDTEPIDVDFEDDRLCKEFNSGLDKNMPVDDDCLSSYLSGDILLLDDPPGAESNFPMERKRYFTAAPRTQEQGDSHGGTFVELESEEAIFLTKPPAQQDANSKRAMAARERRQKYKQYVSGLESSVKKLTEENQLLKAESTQQKKRIGMLETEVKYLKNVTANKSALSQSALMQNVCNSNCVQQAASFSEGETDENSQRGVCFPVSGPKRKLPTCFTDKSNSVVVISEESEEEPAKCSKS